MQQIRQVDSPLLEVKDLRTYFGGASRIGRAVDNVSFTVGRGETLGIVGESGSGKSVMALSIMRLLPKEVAWIESGEIRFEGVDLLALSESEMRRYRGRHISMVLQDPLTALNPVLTVGEQIEEAIRIHLDLPKSKIRHRAVELLRLLRVPAAEQRLGSYPHEFSGGMRQRVVGAIALASDPKLLIADEPTTALDATVQDQYLRVLKAVQRDRQLAIIFITHDFSVVARICDRVAVMYAGRIVETAPTRELFQAPRHPYAKALLRSLPEFDRRVDGRLYSIEGTPPSIYEDRRGCPFADRCPEAIDRCRAAYPEEARLTPKHAASCWRPLLQ